MLCGQTNETDFPSRADRMAVNDNRRHDRFVDVIGSVGRVRPHVIVFVGLDLARTCSRCMQWMGASMPMLVRPTVRRAELHEVIG